MSNFENIVRPFQTREVTPPRIALAKPISVAQAVTAENIAHVKIGGSWSVKTVNGSETIDVTYYMERWMKERKRPIGQQSVL